MKFILSLDLPDDLDPAVVAEAVRDQLSVIELSDESVYLDRSAVTCQPVSDSAAGMILVEHIAAKRGLTSRPRRR